MLPDVGNIGILITTNIPFEGKLWYLPVRSAWKPVNKKECYIFHYNLKNQLTRY